MQLVSSGGEANQLIDEGMVLVNGALERQRRKKLRSGDLVSLRDEKILIEKG